MNRLKKYNFKDDHGHPLEGCQDYLNIFKQHENELYCACSSRVIAEAERDAAVAVLRAFYELNARGVFSVPDEHYAVITNAAALLAGHSPAPSDHPDATEMVSERERRLEELVEAAYREGLWDGVGEMNESYNGHCNPDEKAMWERSAARATLAGTTEDAADGNS